MLCRQSPQASRRGGPTHTGSLSRRLSGQPHQFPGREEGGGARDRERERVDRWGGDRDWGGDTSRYYTKTRILDVVSVTNRLYMRFWSGRKSIIRLHGFAFLVYLVFPEVGENTTYSETLTKT